MSLDRDAMTTSGQALPQTRLTGLALLGWVGFILLLVYATFLGGGYVGTQAVVLRMLTLLLVALGLLVWFVLAWRKPAWRPTTSIWPAIVLPLAALAITTLLSPLPRLGLEYLAWAMLLFALYLLLVRIMAVPAARERMGGIAALLALIVGIAYALLVGTAWLDWWALIDSIKAPMLRPAYAALTFGGPNIVAPVMVLLAAAAFGGLRPDSRARRLLLVTVAALTCLVVLLAASRASWLAFGVTVVLVGAALGVSQRARLESLAGSRGWRILAVGTVVLAIPVVLVALPAVLGRLAVSGDGGRGSYFAAAVRMFESSPLTGVGTGTWAVRRAANTEPGEVDWYVNHAHNVYLQTLAEMGLVGAFAGIVAIIAVGWLLWRGLRAIDADRRRWAWAALFGLSYLALHDLLDFYANMPVVMLIAAIPVAVLDATSDRGVGLPGASARASALLRRVARGSMWLLCVLAVVTLFRTESIASTHQQAVRLLADGDVEAAQPLAIAAVADDPEMIPYLVTRAGIASSLGHWQEAHDAYAVAASVDDLPTNWLGLAQAQVKLGVSADEVAAPLERALRLGQRQPAVAYAAGYLYDRIGATARADTAYAKAIASAPSLAGDETWTADPELVDRFPAILDEAIENGAAGWQIALMAGDAGRAHVLNDAAGGDAFTTLLIDAWTGDAEALATVRSAADEQPRNGQLLPWAARLSARAGDEAAAARYRQLITYVDEVGSVADEIRVGGTEQQDGVVTSVRTDLYGQMLYRRPLAADLMPPGLPRLVYLSER